MKFFQKLFGKEKKLLNGKLLVNAKYLTMDDNGNEYYKGEPFTGLKGFFNKKGLFCKGILGYYIEYVNSRPGIIKKLNKEVEGLIDKETARILFEIGLPNTDVLDFVFDDELKVRSNYIIFGNHMGNDLVIDLDNNGAIYTTGKYTLFLNSSLSQFIKYIMLCVDYVNKVQSDPLGRKGRDKHLIAWEKAMIEGDKEAFYHPEYYWGSIHEHFSMC